MQSLLGHQQILPVTGITLIAMIRNIQTGKKIAQHNIQEIQKYNEAMNMKNLVSWFWHIQNRKIFVSWTDKTR